MLLGAVPFQSDVKRLKELGVSGVVTLNEPYETLVPTSLYEVSFLAFAICFDLSVMLHLKGKLVFPYKKEKEKGISPSSFKLHLHAPSPYFICTPMELGLFKCSLAMRL